MGTGSRRGWLATIRWCRGRDRVPGDRRAGGRPHLSPVCPIFAAGRVYLSVPSGARKRRDLAGGGRYVLHAFLGPDDEEFAIAGRAREVTAEDERDAVHAAIRFGSFNRSHPVFRLDIESCHWVLWEDAGQPATRRQVRRFRARD